MILIKQYFEYLTGKNAKSLPEWATYVDFLNKHLPTKERLKFDKFKDVVSLSNALLSKLQRDTKHSFAGVFNVKGVMTIELKMLTWQIPNHADTQLPINVDYVLKINQQQLADCAKQWTLSDGKTTRESLEMLNLMHSAISAFSQSLSNQHEATQFETPEQVFQTVRDYVYPVGESKMPSGLQKVFDEWEKWHDLDATASMLHIARQYLCYLSEMTTFDAHCKSFARWINENINAFSAGPQHRTSEPSFIHSTHLEILELFKKLF